MTTELVLLIAIYAFVLLGVFLGDRGPIAVFQNSSPKLAARIERNVTIGREFKNKGAALRWQEPPPGDAP